MTRPDYCPVAQEPCQAMCALSDVRCKIRDTAPQPMCQGNGQREWVSLTDEEIDSVTDAQWAANNHKPIYAAHRASARAIEAKLKEKNT